MRSSHSTTSDLIIAGYQTTATSLNCASSNVHSELCTDLLNFRWSLSRHPKLRNELALKIQISKAFNCFLSTRQAHTDDIIPLSIPDRDANGELIDRIRPERNIHLRSYHVHSALQGIVG
ncbi:hypothetical protein L208DRAFT_97650 [Tricholoma matsutake]|nr:hypothetical protein L208DRAFT_97650 [Tricholoma matsutake 945]